MTWNLEPIIVEIGKNWQAAQEYTLFGLLGALALAAIWLGVLFALKKFTFKDFSPVFDGKLGAVSSILSIVVAFAAICHFFWPFPLEIRYYSVLFAFGIWFSFYLLNKFLLREKLPEDAPSFLLLYAVIGIVVGAHLVHMVFYEPEHLFTERIFQIGKGLASHGGVAGLIIAVLYFGRKYNQPFFKIADMVSVVGGFTAMCVRLGNFANSEIIGRKLTDFSFTANWPWGVKFLRVDPENFRHPSQLYEGLALIIIFLVIYFLYKKLRDVKPHGYFTFIFFAYYFGVRFFLEFFKKTQSSVFARGNEPEPERLLSMGQWLSLPIVLYSLYMLWRMRKKTLKPEAQTEDSES